MFLCYDERNSSQRDTIISDLLSSDVGVDCAVSYSDNLDIGIDAELLQNELSETHGYLGGSK